MLNKTASKYPMTRTFIVDALLHTGECAEVISGLCVNKQTILPVRSAGCTNLGTGSFRGYRRRRGMVQNLANQVRNQDMAHLGFGAQQNTMGGNRRKYGFYIIRDDIFPAA